MCQMFASLRRHTGDDVVQTNKQRKQSENVRKTVLVYVYGKAVGGQR